MGNFFRVTCPFLFRLDTVAYFPLLRGRHSYSAVAKIRDTTQLLLDVYSDSDKIYIHPLKVWNRYSPEMFTPHLCPRDGGECEPLRGGIPMSRYYQLVEEANAESQDQNLDSYDRFFALARLEYKNGNFSDATEEQIIESTMTKDERLHERIKRYFKPRDYFHLRDRMVGSGAIGGKACGMLLARRIVKTELPEYDKYMEPHDSFYIGSDVFYTYIVFNECWETRIKQRTEEGYFPEAENLKNALLSGEFPPDIREKFRSVLEYFSGSPIIVRSSSFLEDGFGNAFAGKYESVFCVSQGTPELGVPVAFADISGFCGICEVSDNRAGYMPELSYGSHMFQDLVEADIFYCAIWNDGRTEKYCEGFFDGLKNIFPEICPDMESLFPIIRVTEPTGLCYWNDVKSGRTLCGEIKK
ncbi:MAG: PEP/pyruvate-binding domain-containing protein [Clostridiales bacterium]|nr:PEP/pyruvate-binding domain-containing protein [Clostridiales bacterium]